MPAYTWATGETITATKLNTLETEAWRVANQIDLDNNATSFSTTSTSYVNVTGLSLTFTANSTNVEIGFFAVCIIQSTTAKMTLAVRINSTDYDVGYLLSGVSSAAHTVGGVVKVTGLTAGNSYTIDGRVKTSAGTALVCNQSGGGGHGSIFVLDVSK
jgi:hypothetical protein